MKLSEHDFSKNICLPAEYRKIWGLFNNPQAFQDNAPTMVANRSASYFALFQTDDLFLNWRFRDTFTNANEMMKALGLDNDSMSKSITKLKLLDYIQFVLNVIKYVNETVSEHYYTVTKNKTIAEALVNNCIKILDRLNAAFEEDGGEIFVVSKDDVLACISMCDQEIKASYFDFLKAQKQSDIKRQKEVLCFLATKLEPHEKELIATEFCAICKDTTMLLNNAGIRHPFTDNNPVHLKFKGMNESELGVWYDCVFKMLLACIAALPYINAKNSINGLKQLQPK